MGERKVLNKYYPPDFNPDKLEKNKRPKDKQDNVRMMLPMSMRCTTCGNYLYIGTKFNMRKETCLDEHYLNIKIYRFYLKCTQCYAEVTFKTDPKNSDYVVEHGAARNYEPWRDAKAAEELLMELKENEEDGNSMKYLENITFDSKRELDILDALDEIKHLNRRKEIITPNSLLDSLLKAPQKDEKEETFDAELNEFTQLKKMKRIVDFEDEEGKKQKLEEPQEEASKMNESIKNIFHPEEPASMKRKSDQAPNPYKLMVVRKKVITEAAPSTDSAAREKQADKSKGSEDMKFAKPESKPPANKKPTALCNYSDDED